MALFNRLIIAHSFFSDSSRLNCADLCTSNTQYILECLLAMSLLFPSNRIESSLHLVVVLKVAECKTSDST